MFGAVRLRFSFAGCFVFLCLTPTVRPRFSLPFSARPAEPGLVGPMGLSTACGEDLCPKKTNPGGFKSYLEHSPVLGGGRANLFGGSAMSSSRSASVCRMRCGFGAASHGSVRHNLIKHPEALASIERIAASTIRRVGTSRARKQAKSRMR